MAQNQTLECLKKQSLKSLIWYAIKYVAILIFFTIIIKLDHDSSRRVLDNVQIYTIYSNCTVMDVHMFDRTCVVEVLSASNDTHFAMSYYGAQWDVRSTRTAEDFYLKYPVGSVKSCMIANNTMRALFIPQYESALRYARLKMVYYHINLGIVITIVVIMTIIPIVILIVKQITKSRSSPQSSDLPLESATIYTPQDSGYTPPDNPYV
jgi:hypothetical protein